MKRLLIVYNPRSSRYADVKAGVLERIPDLKGYVVGKFVVKKGDVDDNASMLAKILREDDLVISAGGDATGVIASNAILKSNKDVTLAVLPYGNFNDLSRTLGTKTLDDVLMARPARKLYPLEIHVDGKFFRYATCYVTIGIMAESVKLFDKKDMRKILKTAVGRSIRSYTKLMGWYFKNRKKKNFMPEFKLNGILQHPKTTDYVAVSGRYMGRVMRGSEDFKKSQTFRSGTDRLASFPRLCRFMVRCIFARIPGKETTGDVLDFLTSGDVEIQAEGEYKKFKNVKKIEVKKGNKCLKVITN